MYPSSRYALRSSRQARSSMNFWHTVALIAFALSISAYPNTEQPRTRPNDTLVNKPGTCIHSLFEPIPSLPGRIYFTPPSIDCKLKGLDAMSSWLVCVVCSTAVFLFGSIALAPIHQFLFLGINYVSRLHCMSCLLWLKFCTYAGIFIVCVGRCLCYAFDPFSYTGNLPSSISRYNNMGAVTTVFTVYSLFLLIWLRSITHPHHARYHANATSSPTNPAFPKSTSCSQVASQFNHTVSESSSALSSRSPPWVSCLTPSSCRKMKKATTNRSNEHALILYSRAVWGCVIANLMVWTREFVFLFYLTQKQVATVKSYFSLGSMAILIFAMALIVLGVNHITVRFVECQAPPLHLDDILIVPYKPGYTSILDVTVRPQFQPLQPLPTRIARSLTGLMLIASVSRMAIGNASLYPPGSADIWLCVQAVIHLMEASILVLVVYGLMVTPDSDASMDARRPAILSDSPNSSIKQKTGTKPFRCPVLTFLRIGNRHHIDICSRTNSPTIMHPSGSTRTLPSERIQMVEPEIRLAQTSTLVCPNPSESHCNYIDSFGLGLPFAHTFEQQFLSAHGRPVGTEMMYSSRSSLARSASFLSMTLPPPPVLLPHIACHNLSLSPPHTGWMHASARRVPLNDSDIVGARVGGLFPAPGAQGVYAPVTQVPNQHTGFVPELGLGEACDLRRPVGW